MYPFARNISIYGDACKKFQQSERNQSPNLSDSTICPSSLRRNTAIAREHIAVGPLAGGTHSILWASKLSINDPYKIDSKNRPRAFPPIDIGLRNTPKWTRSLLKKMRLKWEQVSGTGPTRVTGCSLRAWLTSNIFSIRSFTSLQIRGSFECISGRT